jgi:cytochrome P450
MPYVSKTGQDQAPLAIGQAPEPNLEFRPNAAPPSRRSKGKKIFNPLNLGYRFFASFGAVSPYIPHQVKTAASYLVAPLHFVASRLWDPLDAAWYNPRRVEIANYQLDVILNKLTPQAMQSKDGYALQKNALRQMYIEKEGPTKGARIGTLVKPLDVNIMVLTSDPAIAAIQNYNEGFDVNVDPWYREYLARFRSAIGYTVLPLKRGAEAIPERHHAIATYLKPAAAAELARQDFGDLLRDWHETVATSEAHKAAATQQGKKLYSLTEAVGYAGLKATLRGFLNIEFDPTWNREEMYDLIYLQKQAVLSANYVTNKEFRAMVKRLRAFSKKIADYNYDMLNNQDCYIRHTLNHRKKDTGNNTLDMVSMNIASFMVLDSSSDVIKGIVALLAAHPDVQEKLREELQQLDDDVLTNPKKLMEVIGRYDRLDKVIKEGLRILSPTPAVTRDVSWLSSEPPLMPDGTTIPLNTKVVIPLKKLMMSDKLGPNPLEFDPDRWWYDKRNLEGVDPHGFGNEPQRYDPKKHVTFITGEYPFMPFFRGNRVCPAQFGVTKALLKTALISIFREHKITLSGNVKVFEQIPDNAPPGQELLKKEYYGTIEKVALAPKKRLDPDLQGRASAPDPLEQKKKYTPRDDGLRTRARQVLLAGAAAQNDEGVLTRAKVGPGVPGG